MKLFIPLACILAFFCALAFADEREALDASVNPNFAGAVTDAAGIVVAGKATAFARERLNVPARAKIKDMNRRWFGQMASLNAAERNLELAEAQLATIQARPGATSSELLEASNKLKIANNELAATRTELDRLLKTFSKEGAQLRTREFKDLTRGWRHARLVGALTTGAFAAELLYRGKLTLIDGVDPGFAPLLGPPAEVIRERIQKRFGETEPAGPDETSSPDPAAMNGR